MLDFKKAVVLYNESIEVYVRLLYLPNVNCYLARNYISVKDILDEPRNEKQGINYLTQKIFETSNLYDVVKWYKQRGCKRYE